MREEPCSRALPTSPHTLSGDAARVEQNRMTPSRLVTCPSPPAHTTRGSTVHEFVSSFSFTFVLCHISNLLTRLTGYYEWHISDFCCGSNGRWYLQLEAHCTLSRRSN